MYVLIACLLSFAVKSHREFSQNKNTNINNDKTFYPFPAITYSFKLHKKNKYE